MKNIVPVKQFIFFGGGGWWGAEMFLCVLRNVTRARGILGRILFERFWVFLITPVQEKQIIRSQRNTIHPIHIKTKRLPKEHNSSLNILSELYSIYSAIDDKMNGILFGSFRKQNGSK